MWERACSRMRWVSRYMYRLIHRIREQARTQWFSVVAGIARKKKAAPCQGDGPKTVEMFEISAL